MLDTFYRPASRQTLPVKVKVMSDSLQPCRLYSPWNSPGQNTGVGSLSLLQWIFLTQESNQGLPHCRQILYQMSHKGSPFLPIYLIICLSIHLIVYHLSNYLPVIYLIIYPSTHPSIIYLSIHIIIYYLFI